MKYPNCTPLDNKLSVRIRQWRLQDFGSRGNILRGQPHRGSGGGATRTPDNFRKLAKKFSENCKKCIILTYFSKFFKKPFVPFSRVWTKNAKVGKFSRNSRKFLTNFLNFLTNFSKNVLRKLKYILFYHIFQNSLKTMRSIFVRLDENQNGSEMF